MSKPHWMKFGTLFSAVESATLAVVGEARFDKVFDRVVASCCMAGPEEILDEVTGDFTSCGHVVIYEDIAAEGNPYGLSDRSQTECDGWILSILQNDGGFSLEKIGDYTQSYRFSHSEPDWPEELRNLLERTYWRVLTTAFLVPEK